MGPNSVELDLSAEFEIVGKWDAPLSTVYTDLDKYIYTPGEQGKLYVSVTREDTTRIDTQTAQPVFSSSDPEVASVSADGVVNAHRSGVSAITTTVTWNCCVKSHQLGISVR